MKTGFIGNMWTLTFNTNFIQMYPFEIMNEKQHGILSRISGVYLNNSSNKISNLKSRINNKNIKLLDYEE